MKTIKKTFYIDDNIILKVKKLLNTAKYEVNDDQQGNCDHFIY